MELEPHAGSNVLGAVWYPKAGHINPRKMIKAIAKRAIKTGVDIQLNSLVSDIKFLQGKYVVKTSQGIEYSCQQLILASGAQTKFLGDKLGIEIPVVPVRGTMWSS